MEPGWCSAEGPGPAAVSGPELQQTRRSRAGVAMPDFKGNPQPKPRSTVGMRQVPVRTSQPPSSVNFPKQPCPCLTGSRLKK